MLRKLSPRIHRDRRCCLGRQIHAFQVSPGVDRRVIQNLQCRRFEAGDTVRETVRRQCRGVLESRGKFHARLHCDVTREPARRIHRCRMPLQREKVATHLGRTFARRAGREVLIVEIQHCRARWHIDVKRMHVDRIAGPFDALIAGANNETGEPRDLHRGRVTCHFSLGIKQCHRPCRLRRNGLVDIDDLMGRIRTIDDHAHDTTESNISWRGYGMLQRNRLWSDPDLCDRAHADDGKSQQQHRSHRYPLALRIKSDEFMSKGTEVLRIPDA